jgi:hypothetical protein
MAYNLKHLLMEYTRIGGKMQRNWCALSGMCVLVVLTLVSSAAHSQGGANKGDSSTWPRIKSPSDDFSIRFPGNPEYNTGPMDNGGSIVRFSYNNERVDGLLYQIEAIGFATAPDSWPAAQRAAIDAQWENMPARSGGVVMDRRVADLSGYQARERTWKAQNLFARSRYFFKGRNLYNLSVIAADRNTLMSPQAEYFFACFKVKD